MEDRPGVIDASDVSDAHARPPVSQALVLDDANDSEGPPELALSDDELDPYDCVASLNDEMMWARHNHHRARNRWIGAAARDAAPGVRGSATSATPRLRHAHSTMTYSTAFSGVDTPTVSLNIIHHELDCDPHRPLDHPRNLAAIEFNQHAADELILIPNPPECVFNDVSDFASDEIKQVVGKLDDGAEYEISWSDLKAMIYQPGAVGLTAWCSRHRRMCRYKRGSCHVAGTPCTDWSPQGKCRGLAGRTSGFFQIWCVMRLLLKELVLILENVSALPVAVYEECLRLWTCDTAVLHNETFGIACNRKRRYSVLTLDGNQGATLTRPLTEIGELFDRKRSPMHTWRSYFCERDDGPLRNDVLWAYNRPTHPAKHNAPKRDQSLTRQIWWDALLPMEQDRHEDYHRLYSPEGKCLSLGQDPCFAGALSTETALHTIIRQMHLVWADEFGRFATSRELLQAQGFPVHNATLVAAQSRRATNFKDAVALCSFNKKRLVAGLPSRNRVAMTHQCGNAMCVQVVGSVLMWCSLYVEFGLLTNDDLLSLSQPAPVPLVQVRPSMLRTWLAVLHGKAKTTTQEKESHTTDNSEFVHATHASIMPLCNNVVSATPTKSGVSSGTASSMSSSVKTSSASPADTSRAEIDSSCFHRGRSFRSDALRQWRAAKHL